MNKRQAKTESLQKTIESLKKKLDRQDKLIENLRQSEQRYRAVVEDQLELVCRFLPNFILTFVNLAYADYFGENREELIGRNILDFIAREDRDMVSTQIQSLSKKNPSSMNEQRVVLKGGVIGWLQWSNRIIYNRKGKLLDYQAIGRDITIRKRAELQLRSSQEQLRRQKESLLKKNIAFQEILEQIEVEKTKNKEKITTNIREVVFPLLQRMNLECPELESGYLKVLRKMLRNLASPYGLKLTSPHLRLTPREIEICNMVKSGLSNKEISSLLHLATRTVEIHRGNIRKKLSLNNSGVNLVVFLQSL